LTPPQIQAIRAFLTFVDGHAEGAKWFQPIIAAALENIWR